MSSNYLIGQELKANGGFRGGYIVSHISNLEHNSDSWRPSFLIPFCCTILTELIIFTRMKDFTFPRPHARKATKKTYIFVSALYAVFLLADALRQSLSISWKSPSFIGFVVVSFWICLALIHLGWEARRIPFRDQPFPPRLSTILGFYRALRGAIFHVFISFLRKSLFWGPNCQRTTTNMFCSYVGHRDWCSA